MVCRNYRGILILPVVKLFVLSAKPLNKPFLQQRITLRQCNVVARQSVAFSPSVRDLPRRQLSSALAVSELDRYQC